MNQLVINETTELTQEQVNYILNHIKYDKLKSSFETEIKKNETDFIALLEDFLNTLKPGTRKTYEKFLRQFVNNEKNLFYFTKKDADEYVMNLSNVYSSSSVRLFVSALSSFCSKLVRWDVLEYNIWYGVTLPDSQRSVELVVPDDKDVKTLLDYYKELSYCKCVSESTQESARKMFIAITLLSETGLRVGALAELIVNGDMYSTVSKGKKVRGKLPESFFQAIEFTGMSISVLKDLNKPMVQFNLSNACKKLHSEKKIAHVYHPHSFRHYYAVKQYREHKDIYTVSRLLNHASVQITQRYLESMEIV